MSAIWGAIAFGRFALPDGVAQQLKQPYERCVIDRFQDHVAEQEIFGCGIQYITEEARQERLPIVDDENQLLFTADIMLDNRDELLDRLGMSKNAADIPDGSIAFELLKRYGEECLNDLLGAYAFVFYDKAKKTVSLVLDATGNRCLYYTIQEGVLCFSSLLKPLLAVTGRRKINERWIADFLAMDNLAIRTEYEETPYEGIYRVAPRQIVIFDGTQLRKRLYWDPEPSEMHLASDEEYAERLKEIYRKSIRCLLRADKTSLLLSGGLDSTSVACYAALDLRDQGKTLYTYTSVPQPGYAAKQRLPVMTDESGSVLKTKEYLEGKDCRMECNFLDLAGVNAWDSHWGQMEILEFPYKSLQNLLWMQEAAYAAYRSDSRILLEGGFGNCSISAMGVEPYLQKLYQKHHYITYLKEFFAFSRAAGHGHRSTLKNMLETLREYRNHQIICQDDDSVYRDSYINAQMVSKYAIHQRFMRLTEQMSESKTDYYANRKMLLHDLIFSQKGEIITKQSLAAGILSRDPTIDKRLIEFCMNLPPDQLAKNGVSRRLVREYMAADMPEHVMPMQYGLQSADMVERMKNHWEKIYGELHTAFSDHADSLLADCRKALHALESLEDNLSGAKAFDVMRLCYTAMTLEFIRAAEGDPAQI